MKIRWPHVEQYLAIQREYQHSAFMKWQKSGYRDLAAYDEYMRLRQAIMDTLAKARTYNAA